MNAAWLVLAACTFILVPLVGPTFNARAGDEARQTLPLPREMQAFQAIADGDQTKALALISAGMDVNARDNTSSNLTLLHRTAEQGLRQVVETLVTRGAELDAETPSFRGTPLVLALVNGHEDIARLLLASGADARRADSAGYTPLHVAASLASVPMLEALIEKGARVNATSEIGRTPLHSAILGERWRNASFLIEKGAAIESEIPEGTPLILAARCGVIELVEILVSKGANVKAQNSSGLTALHEAAAYGHIRVAEFLISNGANANASQRSTDEKEIGPPIVAAAYRGNLDVLKLLVARGANIRFRFNGGGNAVSFAAFGGHPKTVEWLVGNGADVNPFDRSTEIVDGLRLPLYGAVHSRDLEMIRFLLARGADVNARARNGDSALRLAKQYDLKEIVDVLVANGAKE